MNRIKWYVKQLLPLSYRSHYMHGEKKMFCVWNMFFGKCYNIEEVQVI